MQKILVTGAAGFIGSKVSEKLLNEGRSVAGVDNLNDYYDQTLKRRRLANLEKYPDFSFHEIDIENFDALSRVFDTEAPGSVINEAARAGVRYSMENPFVYLTTNSGGNLNLLELCRRNGVEKYVLASTSSLYAGQEMPFKENLPVNTPISPYAASKKAGETMAYTYHYLYGLDVSIVRYFTVYGPAGRPDMSVFRFVKWIKEGVPLEIFGDGTQKRDFTYVDDIASGTIKALKPTGYEIINLGNNTPHELNELIEMIENGLGKKSTRRNLKFSMADMDATWADISKARRLLGWRPEVNLSEGISRTIEWTERNWDWISKVKL